MNFPPNKRKGSGCFRNFLLLLVIFLLFFTPIRTNVLILGIDRTPKDTNLGRTDTIILSSLPPVLPRISLFSIPRDLWVNLPGGGENRINTAHYFAELNQPGTGITAARQVVSMNFGVDVPYAIRINFTGFEKIIKAMGGVTVDLPEPMSGLPAGKTTLDSKQALAFLRDRAGSDDFARQKRAQIFIRSALVTMLNPAKWLRIPLVAAAVVESVDTNLPFWLWPRLIYAGLFSAVTEFDAHTIDRNMVTPWQTEDGAQVLLPVWEAILPVVQTIFK